MLKDIKQVLILRNDLNMRRGKSEVQCSHASLKVFFDRMKVDSTDIEGNFTPQMIEWMHGSFKKISLGCDTEKELLHLKDLADQAEIVNALILDNGETEFKQECEFCYGDGKYEICAICGNKQIYTVHDNQCHINFFCDICKEFIDNSIKKESCPVCKGTGKVNKPTHTALAIGPDYASKIDVITGHLKLR